jgi:fucose 4-O-acetylase-like acetyltransferase
LLSGLCYKESTSFQKFFIKKFKKIVVPYLFWSLFSIVLFMIAGNFVSGLKDVVSNSFVQNITEMLYANSKPEKMRYNLPLWFLPCFFSTNVIIFIEEMIAKHFSKWIRVIFIIICVLLGYLFSLYEEIALPWHFETSFSMAVWFVLGIIIKERADFSRIQNGVYILISFALIISGISCSFLNIRTVGVRNEHYGIIIVYYFSAILTIIGVILLSVMIKQCKIIEYIGKNSIAILIFHKFPILFFQHFVCIVERALKEPNSLNGIVVGVVVAFISIAISLVGAAIVKKILPWSLGIQKLQNIKSYVEV